MKTKEEIEQLAEQYTQDGIYLSDSEKQQTEIAYMTGYKQCQEDMFEEAELKDWDVTLNDGLEDEVWDEKLIQELINETVPEPFATPEELQEKPYVSDDFQIGPDGAYEHTQGLSISPREKASELIVDYQTAVKSLDYNEAKQCALVTVDEIKRILYDQDLMIRYDYWFEVKHEIEKL